jgi:hypothetical protein
MSTAAKADTPKCDVPGCGRYASFCTDGTEKDIAVRGGEPLNRKPLVNINVCAAHSNWPFSDDAKTWVAANAAIYEKRK